MFFVFVFVAWAVWRRQVVLRIACGGVEQSVEDINACWAAIKHALHVYLRTAPLAS